jgi:hypothetical protein
VPSVLRWPGTATQVLERLITALSGQAWSGTAKAQGIQQGLDMVSEVVHNATASTTVGQALGEVMAKVRLAITLSERGSDERAGLMVVSRYIQALVYGLGGE